MLSQKPLLKLKAVKIDNLIFIVSQNSSRGVQTRSQKAIFKVYSSNELLVSTKSLIESRRKLREHFSREITLQPASIAITSVDEQFLQLVMQIMEEHITDAPFGLEAGMSRMQLFRKLKALADYFTSDFIPIMRLKRVAELLSDNAGSIAEAAFLVGFQHPFYFTKCS